MVSRAFLSKLRGPLWPRRHPVACSVCGYATALRSPTPNAVLRCPRCDTRLPVT